MKINLTRRIWLTVATIVLFFTTLVLFIVPSQQERYFLKTFNQEVENLAKTVALGVRIALNEQNFEGVQIAIDFAKSDSRLNFVAMLQVDTTWNADHSNYTVDAKVINVYPDSLQIDPNMQSNKDIIVKRAPFTSNLMNGEIMAGFTTQEIRKNMNQIRLIAIIVSIVVFIFGIFLGMWLARSISVPVKAIRDAAIKVGQGDLSQQVNAHDRDEIGELSNAFNLMVADLAAAEEKIREKNQALLQTLEDLEDKNEQLGDEKKRSDELLLNILPKKTADELKTYGSSKPTYFESVSVMFVDFRDFSSIAEKLSPDELVNEIDHCFRVFDTITTRYGLEKIKTIGDAYLCVGGLPEINQTHAKDCVLAAFEIQQFLKAYKLEREVQNLSYFEARIGIHTGPVVAGIVGSKKFVYDIWGDTVNTAARMESGGEVYKVNISKATHEILQNEPEFTFEYRGKIEAKNKGELEMYFVSPVNDVIIERKSPPMLKQSFEEIKQSVTDRLKQTGPHLTYHNLGHMRDVLEQAVRIAGEEGVTDEEQLMLLKVAVLYHDIGYLESNIDHEANSCKIFIQDNEDIGFTDEQVDTICDLIMATQVPQKPKNLLEEIICDADLDYLGRTDFEFISEGLKKEFKHFGIVSTDQDYDRLQVRFFESHQYFTASSIAERNPLKQKHLKQLKASLES